MEKVKPGGMEFAEDYKSGMNVIDNYDIYRFKKIEYVKYCLMAYVTLFIIGYTFYRSIILSALLACLALLYPGIKKKSLVLKRKIELKKQFRDGLISLAASLGTGAVIEKAFEDAVRDLKILYPNVECMILDEFNEIIYKRKSGLRIEESLLDFASRAKVEDISNFVDVFITSNQSGGNNASVIRSTVAVLSEKMEIESDIEALLAGKKFEQNVLCGMPFAFILLLSVLSGDYMEPVFEFPSGTIVMTIVLAIIGVAYFVSKKIMDIEV